MGRVVRSVEAGRIIEEDGILKVKNSDVAAGYARWS
jgi:hypothetical protein